MMDLFVSAIGYSFVLWILLKIVIWIINGYVDFFKLISKILDSATFLVLRKKIIKGSNYITEIK